MRGWGGGNKVENPILRILHLNSCFIVGRH